MKRNDASDYEVAWWKYLNRNPELKRFIVAWDSLSIQRRRVLTAIARGFVMDDAKQAKIKEEDYIGKLLC